MVPEELDENDPAIAHRNDVRELDVRLRAMARSTPEHPHSDSVTNVDEVAGQFHGVGLPGLAELLELTHDRLPTYKGAGLRPALRGSHDDVGVVQVTKGVHVPRIPRLE